MRKAIAKQIVILKTQHISQAELNRIKVQMIASKTYAKDSLSAQATELGSLISVGLLWQLSDTYIKHIQAVTPEQVQSVAKIYLQTARSTVAILHPQPMTVATEKAQQRAAMSPAHGGVS